MIPKTNALLISALYLCALEETVLSQRGHCAGNQCYALIQRSEDFPGAQKSCKEFNGQLLVVDQKHVAKILSGLSGSFWLDSTGRAAQEAAVGLQNCSFIYASKEGDLTVLSQPCSKKLDGFLCQHKFEEPCGGFQAGEGAKVKYTAFMGFEVKDAEMLPLGTIAVAEKADSKYPESKGICFSKSWMKAPWPCEVAKGGCEDACNSTTCACPEGQILHSNGFSCTADPCAKCAHECQRDGDTFKCKCRKGFKLAQDRRSCVDVDECRVDDPCTGEGEECLNTPGGFNCTCKYGFVEEDGGCVDVRICQQCEHMKCLKFDGVYKCVCRNGSRVSPKDPTKCEAYCTVRDCPAKCDPNSKGGFDCSCPEGYIRDEMNSTQICTDIDECVNERPCQHKCENTFGGHRCSCNEGFKLHNENKCVPIEEPAPSTTAPSAHQAAVPSYVKTGSVLGITVFMTLCAVLLCFLVRTAAKRCGTFKLTPFKHPDIDIFYLQQVTTDTYKRLSFDKQLKNDSQRL